MTFFTKLFKLLAVILTLGATALTVMPQLVIADILFVLFFGIGLIGLSRD